MAKKKTKLFEWQQKAKEGGACSSCKRRTDVLSVDHVVPAHIVLALDASGKMIHEDEDNFTLLCIPCNKFKAGKINPADKKIKQLLQKYIDLL